MQLRANMFTYMVQPVTNMKGRILQGVAAVVRNKQTLNHNKRGEATIKQRRRNLDGMGLRLNFGLELRNTNQ